MSDEQSKFYPPNKEVGGWEKWHDWQAEVMRPVLDWYLRAAGAAAGRSMLDVACGTGLPALALAERIGPTGKLVAVDPSPKMLGALERKVQAAGLGNVEIREAQAAAIGGPDAAFDAVTCKDGLMFCPDVIAALREMRRVLKPGGRYAFSVWAEPHANPCFTTLFGAVAELMKLEPPPPDAPGPFRLAAPLELERVVRAGGFSDLVTETIPITFTFTSVAQHWEIFSETAGPIERAVATLPAPELSQLKQKIADAIAPYATADGLRIPGLQLCVSNLARRI